MRQIMRIIEGQQGTLTCYHITDNAKFKLNPDYAPEDNSIAIVDRSGNKGIYLAREVERWVNGHRYARPFAAEILVDPSALEHDRLGRWGGEIFIPADQFDKLTVNRVIPIDAYARETYRQHGWFERALGIEFDTGNPITVKDWEYPFDGYRFPGDTRKMSNDEIKRIKQHFKAGYRKWMKG